MRTILLIALLGAAGAVSRYSISGWTYRWLGVGFPYGTLVVNVLGCFLLGVVVHLAAVSTAISQEWRAGITIGFLGAFTTFSTFGYDTLKELEEGRWGAALVNVGLSLALGLLAVWAGMNLARVLWGGP